MSKAAPFALERQVKNIQFRIQQKISIADDEIERFSEVLTQYKSEIVRKEKELERIQGKIDSLTQIKDGEKRRMQVDHQMRLSQMTLNHQLFIQKLREEQENEINRIQDEFGTKLENISNLIDGRLERSYKSVEKEIEMLRNTIDVNAATLSRTNRKKDNLDIETKDHCNTINNGVILQLRSYAQKCNNERANNLLMSRAKLQECVAQIEDMEKEHITALNDRKNALEHIDKQYEKELASLAQQHNHKILMLSGHLTETQKRMQILRKAAHNLEQSNEQQLHETMKEIDMMPSPVQNDQDYEILGEEQKNGEELEKKRSILKMELRKKEELLDEVRNENSKIRKDIAAVSHQVRMGARKAQFGI
ncbi:hypothetical protein TVAG_047270 [Trichomonas vaginalis G3]|uniref:Uncharacterized protein n=1 Tax=Trichomonas vaginalis (strain ATCC PRA-98 / G3) TaxID=412133 RepID=A2FHJ4_TRIV3|nr:hypothetical protein TVAGG3_0954290 [Trichomonas vaginalis G3]EAX95629.1 hypothetical protein TVAG_047270 [Trichomonas vaginalis G3]KAI5487438.1 hypothetical protein TVAGG3_0954290 [Trichomonas vaginalis G3]|eukprot:XP_001308559.1 hypothetical protein [Trichomonas vaginalis G3]